MYQEHVWISKLWQGIDFFMQHSVKLFELQILVHKIEFKIDHFWTVINVSKQTILCKGEHNIALTWDKSQNFVIVDNCDSFNPLHAEPFDTEISVCILYHSSTLKWCRY